MMKNDTLSAPAGDFDLSDLDAIDEARFVAHQTETVLWVWVYAGPGHPKTIAAAKRRTAKSAKESAAKEQAQVNGRKWKAEEQTYDDIREETISIATDRLLGWHLEDIATGEKLSIPIKLNGQEIPFSEENAKACLRDPKRIALLNKALEWLGDERSFTNGALNRSVDTPSAPTS